MSLLLWPGVACAGLYLAYLVLLYGVCRWEQHMVWPFLSPEEARRARPTTFDGSDPYAPSAALGAGVFPAPGPAALRGGADAADLGFTPLGQLADRRGSLYWLRADVWLAGERDVLAFIVWGKLAGIPHQTIRLRSGLADGRVLVSINDQKGTGVDLTGGTIEDLDPGADLARLLAWHRGRATGLGVALAPYATPDPLGEVRAHSAARADGLERAGLIRFLDPGRTTYRYRAWGALLFMSRLHAVTVRRGWRTDARRRLAPAADPRGAPLGQS